MVAAISVSASVIEAQRSLRIMTYNVHGCVGTDTRLDPERIVRAISSASADVVALQEVDVGQHRSRRVDQAAFIAERLEMNCSFFAAREAGGGHYGNAVLSRYPVEIVQAACLPTLRARWCEPRAALRVRVKAPFGDVDVLTTHLALRPSERSLQSSALIGEWLADLAALYGIFCGDLNAAPGSHAYTAVAKLLRDAQLMLGRPAQCTWPSIFPLLRIDHVFVGARLGVASVAVPNSALFRLASDHLPLVVDVTAREAA